jgi:hypothetical protein
MQGASQAVARDTAANQPSPEERESSRRFFAENGYAIFRDVVPKDQLARLHARVADAYEAGKADGTLFSGGGQMSGHLNCFPGEESRFVYEALERRGILDLLKLMFPKPIGPMHVGCNFNLPGSVAQHWHVDCAYIDEFLIVNTAVVDTDLVNGAIDVIPGTHKRFYAYWRFAVERTHRDHMRLPLKQGDVLVRSSNLWHRGMPNFSSAPRPMVAFTFGDKGAKHLPEPFKADDGTIKFHANWFRTNFLGRLRERTFVAAPITYSALRFVKSLVGSNGYASY